MPTPCTRPNSIATHKASRKAKIPKVIKEMALNELKPDEMLVLLGEATSSPGVYKNCTYVHPARAKKLVRRAYQRNRKAYQHRTGNQGPGKQRADRKVHKAKKAKKA